MAIISFLTSHWDDVAAVAAVVGGWLGIKRNNATAERARERLRTALRSEVYRIVMDPAAHQHARDRLVDALDATARKLNIPSKIAEAIAETLVDEALALFYEKVIERNLIQIANTSKAVAAKLGEVR